MICLDSAFAFAMAVSVLCLVHTVPWVGLWYVNVALPGLVSLRFHNVYFLEKVILTPSLQHFFHAQTAHEN